MLRSARISRSLEDAPPAELLLEPVPLPLPLALVLGLDSWPPLPLESPSAVNGPGEVALGATEK